MPTEKSTLTRLNQTPLKCPLCGGDNACVMQSATPGSKCWCEAAEFSDELLARVPKEARRKVCICAKCVAAEAKS